MTIESAIITQLTAYAPLSSVVGNRVFPFEAVTQGTVLPYITYKEVSYSPANHLGGVDGLTNGRFQFDIWAATRLEMTTIRGLLKDALVSSDSAFTALPVGRQDEGREPGAEYWRYSLDFSIWYSDE